MAILLGVVLIFAGVGFCVLAIANAMWARRTRDRFRLTGISLLVVASLCAAVVCWVAADEVMTAAPQSPAEAVAQLQSDYNNVKSAVDYSIEHNGAGSSIDPDSAEALTDLSNAEGALAKAQADLTGGADRNKVIADVSAGETYVKAVQRTYTYTYTYTNGG